MLRSLVLFVLLLSSTLCSAADQPNILFIMSDDHAFQAMSCYGSKVNKTPNLDRIANEGMRFDRCYVTNSICGPCRAVILTGKYSHLNGFERNGRTFDGSQQTVAKLLQKSGYQTAVVGKWHLRSVPTGFDYFNVLIGQGPYYNPPMKTAGENGEPKVTKHTGYTTDIITDHALDWLNKKRDPDKPFFLMYQHKAPHRNWQPGPKYLTKYDDVEIPEPPTLFDDYATRADPARQQKMTIEKDLKARDLKLEKAQRGLTASQQEVWDAAYGPKNAAFHRMNLQGKDLIRWKYQRYVKDYLRCVDSVDENVGRVLDRLDELGIAENTIVIYTSDQGWYLGDHGWFDKRWMYEESFRTPLIVRWPKKIKPGSVCTQMAMNLDFAETFLEAAGAPIPTDMQGASLVPLMEGKQPVDWRTAMYYHYYEFPGAHSVARHYGIRTDRYKLIHYYPHDGNPTMDQWELFDLQQDPDELQNIYSKAEHKERIAELKGRLYDLRAKYKDDGTVVGDQGPRKRRNRKAA